MSKRLTKRWRSGALGVRGPNRRLQNILQNQSVNRPITRINWSPTELPKTPRPSSGPPGRAARLVSPGCDVAAQLHRQSDILLSSHIWEWSLDDNTTASSPGQLVWALTPWPGQRARRDIIGPPDSALVVRHRGNQLIAPWVLSTSQHRHDGNLDCGWAGFGAKRVETRRLVTSCCVGNIRWTLGVESAYHFTRMHEYG